MDRETLNACIACVTIMIATAALLMVRRKEEENRRLRRRKRKMTQMCIEPKPISASERDDGAGTSESWDYVYRNLESRGYSKDLGQRGDLLQGGATAKEKEKPPPAPPPVAEEIKRARRGSKYSTHDKASDKPSPAEPQKHAAKPTTPMSNGDAVLITTKKSQPSPPAVTATNRCQRKTRKTSASLNTKEKDSAGRAPAGRRHGMKLRR